MAIPYQQIDKDLHSLVRERVSEAITSVVQLANSPAQAYLIAVTAGNVAVGMWAGAMAAHHGAEVAGMKPADMLEAFAAVMRETGEHP
jgi:ribosomal protein S12 methylthiotransferase accessory factor YcaO